MADPGSRDPSQADAESADAISWLLLSAMAAAVVIGLFLMLRTG